MIEKIDNLVTDKYLDLFYSAWGGNSNISRRKKIEYVIDKQNEIIHYAINEMVGSEEDLDLYLCE